jgi:hypothetical protein
MKGMLVYKNYASNKLTVSIFGIEPSTNCKILYKVLIKFYVMEKIPPELPGKFKFRKTLVCIPDRALSEMVSV